MIFFSWNLVTIQIVMLFPPVQLGLNNYASKHDLRKMAAQHKMKIWIKRQIFIINFILLAENEDVTYEAYVSEQNLLKDDSKEPIKHPLINEIFSGKKGSSYFKQSN